MLSKQKSNIWKVLRLSDKTYKNIKLMSVKKYGTQKKMKKYIEYLIDQYEFNEFDFKNLKKKNLCFNLKEKTLKKLNNIQKKLKGKGISTEEIIKVLLEKDIKKEKLLKYKYIEQ